MAARGGARQCDPRTNIGDNVMLTRFLISIAMVSAMIVTATAYPEKSVCDEKSIEPELSGLIAESPAGHFGLRMVYVKNVSEISRTTDEVRCRLTMSTNIATEIPMIFRFFNRDGHALVGYDATE
jgi:hypothetical protein